MEREKRNSDYLLTVKEEDHRKRKIGTNYSKRGKYRKETMAKYNDAHSHNAYFAQILSFN